MATLSQYLRAGRRYEKWLEQCDTDVQSDVVGEAANKEFQGKVEEELNKAKILGHLIKQAHHVHPVLILLDRASQSGGFSIKDLQLLVHVKDNCMAGIEIADRRIKNGIYQNGENSLTQPDVDRNLNHLGKLVQLTRILECETNHKKFMEQHCQINWILDRERLKLAALWGHCEFNHLTEIYEKWLREYNDKYPDGGRDVVDWEAYWADWREFRRVKST